MDTAQIKIHKIKNIVDADFQIPFDNGIYTFVGANGCGKSTIMLTLAQLVTHKLNILSKTDTDTDTYVEFNINNKISKWTPDANGKWIQSGSVLRFNGMYEGSLFYGTRFEDSSNIDSLISKGKLTGSEISDSDDYVKDYLSYILHGDKVHYRTLKRIKNRRIAARLKITNLPYFVEVNGHLINQYRMSSGECLLVSLLHFLYNSIVRKSLPVNEKVVVLIDELELALHPIAVVRLLQLLNELVESHPNLIIYLSTHSPEIIKTIPPNDIYLVNNVNGIIKLESNCYPSYLIRDLYSNVSPDFLLLVEDELAQLFVNRVLSKNNLRQNKMIHCVPVGGWQNVFELHRELYSKKVLGNNTKIISILDGDVESSLTKKQKSLVHCFLPIPSVEKFLYSVIKENKRPELRKKINDKYFIVRSLNEIVSEYNKGTLMGKSDDNKSFYAVIRKELNSIGTDVNVFIVGLCDEIENTIDSSKFVNNLQALLV